METVLQQLTRGSALFLIIILGIGGTFQSGYHITGLSSPSPYIKRFINSSWYDRYEEPPPQQTVTIIWSLIVSMYAVGGLFGAVSVKFISGMVGRKKAMIGNSCIAIVAAGIMLTSKGAKSYEMIIVARILHGYSAALQSLWGQGDFKQEMDEMLAEQEAIEAAPPKSILQLLRDRTVRWQLITMSLIYCCNQLSGMSAISTFSFDIFRKAGIPGDKIRYVTLGLGVSEILTFISCDSSYWVPYITAGLIILFIIFFCGGPAGATATLNSEIFIQSNRMAAFVLTGIQRWLVFAVLGLVFPFLINALDSYCFVIFACMCLLGCLYTFFVLPETKGKTLLEISEEFNAISVCGKSFLEEMRVETKL
eukprot:superscaffoldBa00003834_g17794